MVRGSLDICLLKTLKPIEIQIGQLDPKPAEGKIVYRKFHKNKWHYAFNQLIQKINPQRKTETFTTELHL